MKDANFAQISELVSAGVKKLSHYPIPADILEDFIFLKMGVPHFSADDKAVLTWYVSPSSHPKIVMPKPVN